VKEYDISHFDHDIDTSNLINGRPIYYLKDKVDMVIGPSLNPGYLALVRCDNIRVENLVLENNGQGILLASTENSLIENCTFSNNSDYGILLCYSSNNNTIENNTCENNNIGTGLWSSSNNTIFHNYLLNNAEINAYDYSGTNYWDENGEGNYWGDWQPPEHPDSDNDGIVDEPRPIAGGTNQDGYPLVVGFGGVTSPTTTPAPAETTWIWAAFGIGAVIVIAIVALVLTHRK
jgi:parallel beta-helix repeat protein